MPTAYSKCFCIGIEHSTPIGICTTTYCPADRPPCQQPTPNASALVSSTQLRSEFVPPHIAPLIDRHANSLLQMLLHWYRALNSNRTIGIQRMRAESATPHPRQPVQFAS